MEEQQIQKEQKQKGKKSATLLLLLILLVTITVGFAVLSTTLYIKGSSAIAGGSWCVGPQCDETCTDAENPRCGIIECGDAQHPITCDIKDCKTHPDHCTCTDGKCAPDPIDCTTNPEKCTKPNCTPSDTETCVCPSATADPTYDRTKCIAEPQVWLDGETIYFDHTLEKPGDLFTFTTKYSNGGTLDAKVTGTNQALENTTAANYMTYGVTYEDGTAVAQDQSLNAGSSVKFKVTVAYKDNAPLPSEADLAAINVPNATGRNGAYSQFHVTYGQK